MIHPSTLRGSGVAIVTPFLKNGSIDEKALRNLVDFQIGNGTHFIIPCGTTGESAAMEADERKQVIRIVIDQTKKRVPVIAGTGTNSTASSITYSKQAQDLGADGVLLVGPYYNKPTQEGYFQHFKTIAESISIPAILYNVPGRTGGNIEPKTILRLAEIKNIIGVKEASANFGQFMEILGQRSRDFLVLSGDDALTLPMMPLGADGVISVAANQIPRAMSDIVKYALDGNFAKAREIHYQYLELMNFNFVESNPIPVKCALALMGLIEENYRLPLVPMQEANKQKMKQLLFKLKLISQ
ncbi:4-hydroxy-tetrahydrodipicolinate synthase [bacterium]|nr:4-hydroxy-tetrahydrodipicolinate synthase [bacterium]